MGFKEEHVLMIVPGSQTTLAQLGIPESYTPASHRFPTRMFPGETPGFFEAVKVRERKPKQAPAGLERRDAAMNGVPGGEGEAEILYEEDLTSDEGAIYPIVKGAIVDWPCFMAFLTYIYNTLSPPFHTPILIVAQPAWRQDDLVKLCQFVFQTFKTPAFNVIDSAAAVNWAWGRDESTVIDVGYEKCDITAVTGFAVDQTTRSIALDYGGEFMTQKLLELLRPKGFDRNMCEQLKRSPICEILPLYTPLPTEHAHPGATTDSANPAAAASTGATSTEAGAAANLPAQNNLPRGPGLDTEAGLDDLDIKDAEDNDGVLDIASIVASGKTNEFLAKQERQKAEKAAKKAAADLASAPRPVRLPNSQRAKATFHYEQRKPVEESATNGEKAAGPDVAPAGEHGGEVAPASRKEERRRQKENATFVRKEIEVGVERFQAGNYMIEQIAAAVHRVILKSDISRRAILWDSLIICGNGSKVKGFKDALYNHLRSKYLISPSSATIFTSELPSNFSTPLATGANTPLPQGPLGHHAPSVNPLLLAATTASNHNLAPPSHAALSAHLQMPGGQLQQHHVSSPHYGQTPTSIKVPKVPDFFSAFKDAGVDEVVFLGAQCAAKVLFFTEAKKDEMKSFMPRADYNEFGPQAIHNYRY